ncbi:MAG: competence/damage-inducible protein A [Legionella sp.]|nr:competence/damage-inducible protein A [Legionella sp.]
MAHLTPPQRKTIAFLATGNELLQGVILESNSHRSAELIHQAGGIVQARSIVGDNQEGITSQLLHLLNTNDAVITIGGLGPTSDDRTRFALSDATKLPLELDENAWKHVQARLTRFGLKITDANKQQALFPKQAHILENALGTAHACHLQWQGKDIFMLPGPPKEYQPLFEKKVLPYLKTAHYFNEKKTYSYLTLGLIEGEISNDIDAIAARYRLETGYRWDYPYLEIKIIAEGHVEPTVALEEIDALLNGFTVSTDGLNAHERLLQTESAFTSQIWVITSKETQSILSTFPYEIIHVETEEPLDESFPRAYFTLSWPNPNDGIQRLGLSFICKHQGKTVYQHQLSTPKRETGIEDYIQSYFAWQIQRLIQLLEKEYL